MENLSVFVERLKEYMEEHGLNATSLASEIKFSRATVSGLLHKAHVPSTEIIIAMVKYFNCSADYLLGLVEYPRLSAFEEVKPFGNRLRECLTAAKKTEYRLQKDLKVSSSLTYRWLNNISLPKVDTLIRLKDYFGCSIDYLLGREN